MTACGICGAGTVVVKSPHPELSVKVSSAFSVLYCPLGPTHATFHFHSLPPISTMPKASVKSSRVVLPYPIPVWWTVMFGELV